jgi:hypothetical protein
MKTFEYTTVNGEDGHPRYADIRLKEKINKLGKQGWELVNIVINQYDEPTAYLKRKVE